MWDSLSNFYKWLIICGAAFHAILAVAIICFVAWLVVRKVPNPQPQGRTIERVGKYSTYDKTGRRKEG